MTSATELQDITRTALEESFTTEEILEGYLDWFRKRGERFLTTAAKLGYTEATLDLPIQLARSFNRTIYSNLCKGVRKLVPGCIVNIVEEDYEGQTLYKMEISWKEEGATIPMKSDPVVDLLPSHS